MTSVPHPKIVSNDVWLAARKELLTSEKELTKAYDALNARRRRLPMVRVEKAYTFATSAGPKTLIDLFEGRRQLLAYHFMFDPAWDKGCQGCTSFVQALGDLSLLAERDATFVLVSRAPLAKLDAYKAAKHWKWNWVSSFESDFNYDFHVTFDKKAASNEYNYQVKPEISGEMPGLSVFFRLENEVFHTYSTYARGGESVTDACRLLDLTPYGRQQDFEDSPAGWPQRPTYG